MEIENKKTISSKVKFTILAIVLIILFCVAITPVTLQNDTFYTIKIGEHIQNYGVDMKDPFSWHEGLSYTYPHWAYDLITYWIYSGAGMQGIYIATCILSCILGLSIYFVNSKLNKSQIFSFVLTIATMYLMRGYIAARAQLVTFILFIWTIYLIEKFMEKKKIRYGIGLVVIPILIANLHVAVWPFYFILYLPYIAQYFICTLADITLYRKIEKTILQIRIGRLNRKVGKEEKKEQLEEKLKELNNQVSKIKKKREEEIRNPYKIKMEKNSNAKWLILIMIICIFTGLLTPIGNTPYTYLSNTMQGQTTQNINEHLPMTLANQTEMICVIIILLAILIFTKTKIRLQDLLMIGGLCYLMLTSRRQLTMFVMIGSVILNRLLMEMDRFYAEGDLDKKLTKAASSLIGSTIIIGMMIIFSVYMAKPKLDDPYIDKNSYPVEASDYILNNLDLGKIKLYNEYNYGSYLLFRGIPVFIDSRADLYAPEFNEGEDIFMDFINTSNIGTFYEDTFQKYGITHVICYKNSKMNMIINKTKDQNYKLLYEDKSFVLYERISATE